MKTKYTDNNGQEIITDGIPSNTYACMGAQPWAKKGELMKVIHGPELTPLINAEDGSKIIVPEKYAGMTFDGSKWYNQ